MSALLFMTEILFEHPITRKIVDFLIKIGVHVRSEPLVGKRFCREFSLGRA